MIKAFHAGGDFHSRTALNMQDYISKAIEDGKVALERDINSSDKNIPLVKDI